MCGLCRDDSPAGCVLGSASSGQVWLLWSVQRGLSYRMYSRVCFFWSGLACVDCAERTVLQDVFSGLLLLVRSG